MKLLEENTCRTLFDINHSNMILHPPPRIMKIKTKINKWGLIKLKSFCTANAVGQGAGETLDKMKRRPSGWENIFENDVTDKGLLSNTQAL